MSRGATAEQWMARISEYRASGKSGSLVRTELGSDEATLLLVGQTEEGRPASAGSRWAEVGCPARFGAYGGRGSTTDGTDRHGRT